MRIALLDNDADRAGLACQALRALGHACLAFEHASKLLEHLQRDDCDMLILDWQAENSGPALLRRARGLPVLVVTTRSTEGEIAAALDAGAGDYLIKPLRRGELAMRVQVMLKRAYPEQHIAEEIHFGAYAFNTQAADVTLSGKAIRLTQKEFELALLFFRNLGRPLSRAYIQDAIWPREAEVPSRTMDTHVSRVRSKLRLRPENGFRLAPVYSYGYRLEQLAQ